jgi:hypothetical protein
VTVTVVLEVQDEYADPDDPTGLTNEGYELLCSSLGAVSAGIVDVTASS